MIAGFKSPFYHHFIIYINAPPHHSANRQSVDQGPLFRRYTYTVNSLASSIRLAIQLSLSVTITNYNI
jgi:hypothetical protein